MCVNVARLMYFYLVYFLHCQTSTGKKYLLENRHVTVYFYGLGRVFYILVDITLNVKGFICDS